jgi:hypothetical protein
MLVAARTGDHRCGKSPSDMLPVRDVCEHEGVLYLLFAVLGCSEVMRWLQHALQALDRNSLSLEQRQAPCFPSKVVHLSGASRQHLGLATNSIFV